MAGTYYRCGTTWWGFGAVAGANQACEGCDLLLSGLKSKTEVADAMFVVFLLRLKVCDWILLDVVVDVYAVVGL